MHLHSAVLKKVLITGCGAINLISCHSVSCQYIHWLANTALNTTPITKCKNYKLIRRKVIEYSLRTCYITILDLMKYAKTITILFEYAQSDQKSNGKVI